MNRRSFVLSAAFGASAQAMTPVGAAVMGLGHAHAVGKVAALRAMAEFRFVGIFEPDAARRGHDAFRGARWLSEREILDDPSIELVAVESRVQDNLKYARMCIDAGKHVHLDKAPGEDLSAFRQLLSEAARRRRTVQIGYQWRYHPAMRAAIEAARQGWLGRVSAVRATIDKPIPPAERIQLAAFRGGMMFELGCHMIDRAVDLLGKPRKVTGMLYHHSRVKDSLADNTLAILEFDEAVAEIFVSANQPFGGNYRTFQILGTNGFASATPFSPARLLTDLKDAAGPYKSGPRAVELPEPRPAFSPDFLEMVRIIRHGATPSFSPEHDVIAQQTLLEACNEKL